MLFSRNRAVVPSANNLHATDETLEQYGMARLSPAVLEEFEEHLLICAACQVRLAATDAWLETFRSAAAELERQPSAAAEFWFPKLFVQPNPAWAGGLVALGLLIAASSQWPSLQRAGASPAMVWLHATRGEPAIAEVPAGKPLTLVVDLTGLPALSQYRLEIVDESRNQAFLTYAPGDNQVRTTVAQGLPSGAHYVRVYVSQELLREYGLKVR